MREAPSDPTDALPRVVTLDSIAEALHVSRRTIERMKSAGKLPRPDLRVGRLPRWRALTIAAWIDQLGPARGGRP